MRVGLISDVHGNRIALEAVLSDMPPVDALACAGDVVGYNPWAAACVDRLRSGEAARVATGSDDAGPVPTIRGNHDAVVVAGTNFRANDMARAGVEHARETLSSAQLEWLADLPETRRAFDGRVRLVHGHPADPDRYTYPRDFSAGLLGEEDVLVLGHTHVQHAEQYAEGIVVNPGSVGQPRDEDPRAAYAVVDLEAMTVETHRVAYDVDAVVAAVEEAGLPTRVGTRLRRGK